MRVKFKVDCVTKEAKPQTFKAGEVHDLSDASAQHWINRGKAVELEEPVRKSRTAEAMVPGAPVKGLAADVDADDSPVSDENAHEAIGQISRMRSEDKLQSIIDSDQRPTVVEAAKVRLQEVSAAK